MPPKPIDYSKTVIYKICCKDLAVKELYVGSTTSMVKRRYQHKHVCSNEKNKKYNYHVYEFIRRHGGFENWDMVVVEAFPCESDEQKRTRERHWMETLGASLNSKKPINTKDDLLEIDRKYKKSHHAILLERGKVYYQANPNKFLEKRVAFRKANPEYFSELITCACGSKHTRGGKASHKRTAKHIKAMAAL
jgi:hypothetical protein